MLYIPNKNSCVITRDANKTVDVRYHTLVQANCDHDKTKPNILWSLERVNIIKDVQKKHNLKTH